MKILFDYDDQYGELVLAGVFEDDPPIPDGFDGLVVSIPVNRKLNAGGMALMAARMDYHDKQDDPAFVYMPEEFLE